MSKCQDCVGSQSLGDEELRGVSSARTDTMGWPRRSAQPTISPPPQELSPPSWTIESQLIATSLVFLTILALYLAYSCSSTGIQIASGMPQKGGQRVHLLTFVVVAGSAGMLVGPPGSAAAIIKLASYLPLPVSAVPWLSILLAALIVSFRFTAIAVSTDDKSDSPLSPGGSEILQLIRRRRSIFPKDYSGAPVPRHLIHRALEAANWAPTHGKTEPWRFVVFCSTAGLAQFRELKRASTQRTLQHKPDELAAALKKIEKK